MFVDQACLLNLIFCYKVSEISQWFQVKSFAEGKHQGWKFSQSREPFPLIRLFIRKGRSIQEPFSSFNLYTYTHIYPVKTVGATLTALKHTTLHDVCLTSRSFFLQISPDKDIRQFIHATKTCLSKCRLKKVIERFDGIIWRDNLPHLCMLITSGTVIRRSLRVTSITQFFFWAYHAPLPSDHYSDHS